MKLATVLRGESSEQGTFGKIVSDSLTLFTLELPWRLNASNVSCIPTGIFICRFTLSPRLHKWTYEVTGVPGRAGIRIHSANKASQLLGCLSFGEKIGTLDGVKAVLVSRPAITKFEQFMERKPFRLEIK